MNILSKFLAMKKPLNFAEKFLRDTFSGLAEDEVWLGTKWQTCASVQDAHTIILVADKAATLHLERAPDNSEKSQIRMAVAGEDDKVVVSGEKKLMDGIWASFTKAATSGLRPKSILDRSEVKAALVVGLFLGLVFAISNIAFPHHPVKVANQHEDISSKIDDLNAIAAALRTVNQPASQAPSPVQTAAAAPAVETPVADEDIPSNVNQYGISDIPPIDSWARTSEVHVPLPGGGDIKTPGDLKTFGLEP